jgi:cell division inhibitor SulA
MLSALQNSPQTNIRHRMTEVIIPDQEMSNSIIHPLVTSLSNQQKSIEQPWVTWITKNKPSITNIQALGASIEKLRIVHTQDGKDNRWIIWEALQKGNSHTVVVDSEFISEEDMRELETAANIGNCAGIVFRSSKSVN